MRNPIHLRTQGLAFNQHTGLAETAGVVDFRIPQAAGTAQGATYDSKNNELTLHSAIDIQTEGRAPDRIQAVHGTITKDAARAHPGIRANFPTSSVRCWPTTPPWTWRRTTRSSRCTPRATCA